MSASRAVRVAAREEDVVRGARDAVDERILSSALVIAVVAVLLQTAAHLLNAAFLQKYQLNANNEGTAFAWASVVATFGIGLVAALAAISKEGNRLPLVALAVGVSFLSLDDMIAVHERASLEVARALGLSDSFDSVLFPAIYLPILAGVFVLLLRFAREAPPRAGRFIRAGLVLLVLAVAAEALSAKWPPVGEPYDWVHVIEGGVEEAAELAGWILIAGGMAVVGRRASLGESSSRPL